MNKQPAISSIQLALLGAGSALMFPYTYLPILRIQPANQDVWFVLLVAIVYVLILNLPALILSNKFKGIQFNNMLEITIGKVGGKILAFIFMLLTIFCLIECTLITVIYTKIYVLPETPEWAIIILMLVPIAFAAVKGGGTIARLATFIVPFILLTIIFFFIVGIQDMKFDALRPILADSTFLDINIGAISTAARFSEIIIFLIFSFYLKKKSSINRAYFTGLIIFGLSFMLILLPVLMVLGSGYAKITDNPYLVYTRVVGQQEFLERVQSFNILAWFTGTLIKLAIYCFMSSYLLRGIFSKREHKPFVVPVVVIAFIIMMIPFMQRVSTILWIADGFVMPVALGFLVFIIPLILLVIYFIRRKKIDQKIKESIEATQEAPQPSPN